MNIQFETLLGTAIGAFVVGAALSYQLTQYFYTRHLIKSGAAYWEINSGGEKELKIINGRELEMIMIQVADKSRSEDYVFSVIQHPESKQQAECFFRAKLDLL